MPCVRNLSINHAISYFNDDLKKKEVKSFDYYSQEESGLWFGKTSEKLGYIYKSLNKKDFQNIMIGKFEYFDKNNNKINIDLTKNTKNKEHHADIEITLSAPKSVSIMSEYLKIKEF